MDQKILKRDLLVIAFTAFLNFVGLTIAIPIFTPLCLDQANGLLAAGTSVPVRTTILGLLLGVFPLCQFFSSPILGALSDRYGRKPVLLLSVIGNILGYVLMGVSIVIGSLPLAFVSRVIMGFLSGSLSVTQSAMADLSDEKSRPRNFGLLGAAFGASFFIGPALGGILSDRSIVPWFNYALPFFLAAFLALMNFIQIVLTLTETLSLENRRHSDFHALTGPENIIKAFREPVHRRLFLVVFFLGFGFNFFTQFLQVFLIDRFQITPAQIGILFSYIGFISVIVQAVLVKPFSIKFNPSQILQINLVLLALVIPILVFVPYYWLVYIVMAFIPFLNGLAVPNLTSIISGLGDKQSQGEILGVNQSVQAAAQFIPPILGGYFVSLSYSMPMWLASGAILISWFIFVRYRKKQSN